MFTHLSWALLIPRYMYIRYVTLHNTDSLKRHNQAKIIQKSACLFWLLNMAIRCEHVHRLELRKYFKFWVAVAT